MSKVDENRIIRVSEEFKSTQGQKFKIIEYINCNNCTIQFEDGFILKNKIYKYLKIGYVLNPYFKSIYNLGFMGEGIYKSKNNSKNTVYYNCWVNMFNRCYNEKYQEKQPTYAECYIDERWHNFQVFAEWFEENYVKGFDLDKDILIKGNKVYSPETCCFVPSEINNLFIKRQNNRGLLPIGIKPSGNNFQVGLNRYSKYVHLGNFKTIGEAFESYKVAKELYIKEVADKWQKQITEQVYKALYNYKVEIDD